MGMQNPGMGRQTPGVGMQNPGMGYGMLPMYPMYMDNMEYTLAC